MSDKKDPPPFYTSDEKCREFLNFWTSEIKKGHPDIWDENGNNKSVICHILRTNPLKDE